MRYIKNVIVKIILFPVAVLFLIPAYLVFIFHPDFVGFKYKMEK